MQDLYNFFYSPQSAHYQSASQQMAARGQQLLGQAAYLRELRENSNDAIRTMEMITGVKIR